MVYHNLYVEIGFEGSSKTRIAIMSGMKQGGNSGEERFRIGVSLLSYTSLAESQCLI